MKTDTLRCSPLTILCVLLALGGLSCSDKKGSSSQASAKPKPFCDAATIYRSLDGRYGPLIEPVHSHIDWSNGVITAEATVDVSGTAPNTVLMARRAAETVARRNALLVANGVRVNAAGKFADLKEGRVDVEGLIGSCQVTFEPRDKTSRTVTAVVSVPMYGAAGIVRINGSVLPRAPARWDWKVTDRASGEADLVVIDARGTGFRPCLLPRVLTEDGRCVFDESDVSGEIGPHHVAVYVSADGQTTRPSSALPAIATTGGEDKVELKVMITLKAKSATGPTLGELVLPAAELAALAKHADAKELFRAGRLVIIADTPHP